MRRARGADGWTATAMTQASASDTLARVLGIGAIVGLMVAGMLTVGRALADRDDPPTRPPATPMTLPAQPIAAEADVFRTRAGELAVASSAIPRHNAQRRTLAIYRSLRAFPGAPPRIPHGLTEGEFRQALCSSCHLRGGYVARFGGYAPVTPHPEYANCLQCHVPDATKVGIGFPDPVDPVVCSQCHPAPGSRATNFASLDWRPLAWPQRNQRAMEGSPPWIPHDLQLRGNCLACHGGPGAVAEIRTTHPEQVNCRQCHVPAPPEHGEFTRPLGHPSR